MRTTVLRQCSVCGVDCHVSSTIGNSQRASLCGSICRKKRRKEYFSKWVEANRDAVLADTLKRTRKHRKDNPDYFRVHYQKHKERRKEESRDWYANNRELVLDRCKAYKASHPEDVRRRAFKSSHKRRANVKKVFVEHVDPHVVYERDKGRCGICKKRVLRESRWEIDHVIPISKGGAHAYANVQLAHRSCNRSKRDTLPIGQPTLFQVAV